MEAVHTDSFFPPFLSPRPSNATADPLAHNVADNTADWLFNGPASVASETGPQKRTTEGTPEGVVRQFATGGPLQYCRLVEMGTRPPAM